EKQATVQAIEPPKNFSGTNFGQVVSPVLNDQGKVISDVYLAGGNGDSPLAVITLESDGTVSRQAFSFDEGVSVSMIAPLPAKDGRWRAVLSDGRFQSVTVFSLNPADGVFELAREATVSGGAEFGSAIVAADLDRAGGMEIVVASAQGLTVFDEQLSSATSRFFPYPAGFAVPTLQELTENGNQTFLTVLWIDQNPVLAVGGNSPGPQTEPVWTVMLVPFTGAFPEANVQWLTGSDLLPGTNVCTLVAGHLDGDLNTDLIVGACEGTYLFAADPLSVNYLASDPRWILHEENQSVGHVAGLIDLDADGVMELCVAEPDRPAGSGKNGEVLIYELDPSSEAEPTPLTILAAPANEKRFGSSLHVLTTSAGTQELVVGGSNASYLFFMTGFPGDLDPR
ncbi:MAG: hypothetical protein CVU59_01230, partial [Deltaproteobacteria bacterium HGW-Deltaproteobacteria-17]